MISWRIWIAILRPFVAHPLFRRLGVWTPPSPLSSRWERLRLWFIKQEPKFFAVIGALLVVGVILLGFWQTLLLVIFLPMMVVMLLLPIALLLLGNIYGLMSAFAISDAIIHEKVEGRYILLGLTPYGFEGATWALCSLVIHANNQLRQTRRIGRLMYVMLATMISIPLFYLLLIIILSGSEFLIAIMRDLLVALVIALLLSIEFIQSSNTGAIIGMLTPAYSKTRFDTRNQTLTFFIAVQSAAYLTVVILYLLLVLPLLNLLGWTQPFAIVSSFTVLFLLIRELSIVALWRTLAKAMMANLGELDQLTHVGIREESFVVKATDMMVRFVSARRMQVQPVEPT